MKHASPAKCIHQAAERNVAIFTESRKADTGPGSGSAGGCYVQLGITDCIYILNWTFETTFLVNWHHIHKRNELNLIKLHQMPHLVFSI